MKYVRKNIGIMLLVFSGLLAVTFLLVSNPIPQKNEYHIFSDTKEILSVPNTIIVVSNLPFLIVGLLGLYELSNENNLNIINQNKLAYYIFFAGTALVGLGSGYYHLWPDNQTLAWDRVPMTITIMALFSIVISEFISVEYGRKLLIPLILFGLFSVLYWYISELNGKGDLRFYAVVQFFPMLAIPIIITFFTSKFTLVSAYWWLLAAYLLAKVFEHFDTQIHEILTVVGGHSIKHLSAAVGIYVLLVSFRRRRLV
jgi:hypothetical protein